MKIVGVITARYASTRFPGKPLADICGKPMIWWVYNRVKQAKRIDEVYIATDDRKISEVCEHWNIPYIMTKDSHNTSTQRVFEVAQNISADYYIVINGDEPLIDPQIIEQIIPNAEVFSDNKFYVANLMTKIKSAVEVVDNTNIKVVTDHEMNALFMSRSPIPHPKASIDFEYYKHLGILIYTYSALEFFDTTPKGKNELVEDVNELRFIENGMKLRMIPVDANSLSVDTPKDLEFVRTVIASKIVRGELSNE